MHKTPMALTAALVTMLAPLLALPLSARAGVTVTGSAQVELHNTKVADSTAVSTRSLVDQGRGRLGVRASEALGGGWVGLAKFGFQTNTVTGTLTGTALASRAAYIGLKGGFGALLFGRNAGPYKDTNLDPWSATTLAARGYGGESSGAYGHNGFINDSIKYVDWWGGWRVEALVTAGSTNNGATPSATPPTTGDGGSYQWALDYHRGAWRTVWAYSRHRAATGIAGSPNETRAKLAAQYRLGASTLTLQYEAITHYTPGRYNAPIGAAAVPAMTAVGAYPGDLGRARLWYLSYSFRFGNHSSLWLRYGREQYKDQNDLQDKVQMLAFRHFLSRTTMFWVGYQEQAWTNTTRNKMTNLAFGLRQDF